MVGANVPSALSESATAFTTIYYMYANANIIHRFCGVSGYLNGHWLQMSVIIRIESFTLHDFMFEFEFIGVLRHMQRYFSHICDGTDVQADWNKKLGFSPQFRTKVARN